METYEHIKGKRPWKYDVAVLCIFFARDDCFEQSFASVRNARPRKLLLWQDGPRNDKPDDVALCKRCQEIAENIDWDCEVYRFYHEKNIGIWPGAFYSHKWAFTKVDKCIILEDDVVPNECFYPFCKELLDKYENDERIDRITGMNSLRDFYCPDSYFFSSTGTVWGWATWRRVADTWDETYSFLEDGYAVSLLEKKYNSKAANNYMKVCIGHSKEKRAHWETVSSFARFLNSRLCIVPSVNMVSNCGIGRKNSVHSGDIMEEDLPVRLRELYLPEVKEITFPLKHPKYVIDNVDYLAQYERIRGDNSKMTRIMNEIQRFFLTIKNGRGRNLIEGARRRIIRRKLGKLNKL